LVKVFTPAKFFSKKKQLEVIVEKASTELTAFIA